MMLWKGEKMEKKKRDLLIGYKKRKIKLLNDFCIFDASVETFITKIMDNYQNSVAAFSGKQLLNCDPAVPRFCRICGKEIHINDKFEYIRTKRKSDFFVHKACISGNKND